MSCVIVLVACGYFLFLGGTPTGQITEVMVVCARACDDQAFVVLSFFVLVGCWCAVGCLG